MKIDRINIKNYKSMELSGDIYIGQEIFALIGQNNAGKSTVLDAVQCIFPDSKRNVEFKDFHNRKKDVVIEIEFSGVTSEYIQEKLYSEQIEKNNKELDKLFNNRESPDVVERTKKTQKDKIIKAIQEKLDKYEIVNETMILRLVVPQKPEGVGKKYYETRTLGKQISEAEIKKLLPILKVIPAIRNPQNESTAGNNSYMKDLIQMLDDGMQTSIKIDDEIINYNQLNNILSEESNNRCKHLSKELTKKYAESVGNNDFEICITSEVNIAKGTTYTTKLLDKATNLESDMLNCGTGYQSMIILSILETYVELANKKNGYILIIEEPEVYLHPSLQRRMISTLMRLSIDNQVLFSTHSPISVSVLNKNQIGLVVKENGKSHVEKINIRKVISELGICPNDIMIDQAVIIVEGPDDKLIISNILEKIKKNSVEKINVLYSGSCSNLKFYANAEKLLNCRYKIPLLIIRDADSKTVEKQKSKLKEELNKVINSTNNYNDATEIEDDEIFIIGKYSMESLFLTKEILSKITSESIAVCEEVVDIYNLVYDTQLLANMKEDSFAKFYQPKYFFEKKLDSYGWKEDNSSRDIWDKSYYIEWEKAIKKVFPNNAEEKYNTYKKLREKVNQYTSKKAKDKVNYLLELVNEMSLSDLKDTLFAELVDVLEKLIIKAMQ